MKLLIKLHIGLAKYLIKELPKKRTLKELVDFLKQIIGVYLRELLKLYKTLFLICDPTYQKQKKQYNNYQKIKKELQQALKLLQYVDKKMAQQGINRQRRRQFWRDFFARGEVRKETFDELMAEIERIR